MRNIRLRYFALVREAVGFDAEERELPSDVRTVVDCTKWLAAQNEKYAAAFADLSRLRFALDQQLVGEDARLKDGSELAVFPPVTGG